MVGSFGNPDPDWIPIKMAACVRIRIRYPDPDPASEFSFFAANKSQQLPTAILNM